MGGRRGALNPVAVAVAVVVYLMGSLAVVVVAGVVANADGAP